MLAAALLRVALHRSCPTTATVTWVLCGGGRVSVHDKVFSQRKHNKRPPLFYKDTTRDPVQTAPATTTKPPALFTDRRTV